MLSLAILLITINPGRQLLLALPPSAGYAGDPPPGIGIRGNIPASQARRSACNEGSSEVIPPERKMQVRRSERDSP
jgi:hypothetical protein